MKSIAIFKVNYNSRLLHYNSIASISHQLLSYINNFESIFALPRNHKTFHFGKSLRTCWKKRKISDVNFTHKMMIHCHFYWKWKVAFYLFTRLCIKFVIDFVPGCIMNKSTKNRFRVWNHQQKCCWNFFEGLYFFTNAWNDVSQCQKSFSRCENCHILLFCCKMSTMTRKNQLSVIEFTISLHHKTFCWYFEQQLISQKLENNPNGLLYS